MVVRHVRVKSSALCLCLGQCLADDSQLVGLLFGTRDKFNDVIIYDAVLCEKEPNLGKEFGYPALGNLSRITEYATDLSRKHGERLYCVGWYHSHPGYTCEPTVKDLQILERSTQFHPDFLLMIFSVFLSDSKVRFDKYPLCEPGMLTKLDAQAALLGMGDVPGKKIEFLTATITDFGSVCLVPTFIAKDPYSENPKCLETMCKYLAQLFEEKRRQFERELNALESSAMHERISAVCRGNMRAGSNMKLLQITADLYAPIMKLLDDKTEKSYMKQNQLKFQKRQLEDDVKTMRALVNLERA